MSEPSQLSDSALLCADAAAAGARGTKSAGAAVSTSDAPSAFIPNSVAIVLGVACLWSAAEIFWSAYGYFGDGGSGYVAAAADTAPRDGAPGVAPKSTQFDYAIFGKPPRLVNVAEADAAPPLPYKLVGLVSNADADSSFAVITVDGVDQLYSVGQALPNGETIESVEKIRLILGINGELRYMELSDPGSLVANASQPAGSAPAQTASISEDPGQASNREPLPLEVDQSLQSRTENATAAIPRRLLDDRLSLAQMIATIKTTMVQTNSGLRGLRLDEVPTDGVFSAIGMQKGDVIATLNGKSLGDQKSLTALLDSIRKSTEIDVVLVRDGVSVRRMIQITDS